MKQKILAVCAHSDDEVIGCGGTLLKHKYQGDEVHLIFLTNGIGSRLDSHNYDEASRLNAQQLASKQLGITNVSNFDFPDNKLDAIPLLEITQAIETVINKLQPDTVYTHHGGDLNIDHRIAFQAVMTACRPQPGASVKKILSFEVNSATEWSTPTLGSPFHPNYFVEITEQLKEKEELLICYQEEMRPVPHSRSIEAIIRQNKLRGNQVGYIAAEAFMLIRQLT